MHIAWYKSRLNFYPRSPCGERRAVVIPVAFLIGISIHALLAESDCRHSPVYGSAGTFLSTLSLRRATTE